MRRNKRGTSTLFLAVILSALILVETTYIALVADLDRRLTYTRALKEQTEIYLASYNRQLFKTYGIYAFDYNSINSSVFDSILACNGYEDGDVIYASGMYSIDTETLRRSVAAFYSYRSTGIFFDRFKDIIVSLLDELGNGIFESIRSFLTSPASGVVGRIISGGAEIAEAISAACEFLGLDESSPSVQAFISLFETLGAVTNESPDIGNGFDPSDLNFIFDVFDISTTFYDYGTAVNENILIHACLADYASNNFDSFMEDDSALNGTSFNVFHSDNECDCEYILTGLHGFAGCALTDFYIFSCLFVRRLVDYLTDPETEEIITGIADVLSAVVTALSLGSVPLPPEVYKAVILIIMSECGAMFDLISVMRGESIPFLSVGETDLISLDYRGFVTVFMYMVPDELMLNRMLEIFNRDFPGYLTGIDTETDYNGRTITYEGRYEYYL